MLASPEFRPVLRGVKLDGHAHRRDLHDRHRPSAGRPCAAAGVPRPHNLWRDCDERPFHFVVTEIAVAIRSVCSRSRSADSYDRPSTEGWTRAARGTVKQSAQRLLNTRLAPTKLDGAPVPAHDGACRGVPNEDCDRQNVQCSLVHKPTTVPVSARRLQWGLPHNMNSSCSFRRSISDVVAHPTDTAAAPEVYLCQ